MILSAVYVLVVAQSSSEVPEGLMNNPVLKRKQKRCSMELSPIFERTLIFGTVTGVTQLPSDNSNMWIIKTRLAHLYNGSDRRKKNWEKTCRSVTLSTANLSLG